MVDRALALDPRRHLTEYDAPTRGLLTNAAVTALNQENRVSHPVDAFPATSDRVRVWTSRRQGKPIDTVAVFNLSDKPLGVTETWSSLGLPPGAFSACDLWTGARLAASPRARLSIAPHDVALLRVAGGAPARCR